MHMHRQEKGLCHKATGAGATVLFENAIRFPQWDQPEGENFNCGTIGP
jgi:hypothetical protein